MITTTGAATSRGGPDPERWVFGVAILRSLVGGPRPFGLLPVGALEMQPVVIRVCDLLEAEGLIASVEMEEVPHWYLTRKGRGLLEVVVDTEHWVANPEKR